MSVFNTRHCSLMRRLEWTYVRDIFVHYGEARRLLASSCLAHRWAMMYTAFEMMAHCYTDVDRE